MNRRLILALFALFLPISQLMASPLFKHDAHQQKVLASVHPLALMAASVVPADNLEVLVPAGMTPHDFSLRPSDIDLIQNADIIIWSGPLAEPYLKGFASRWSDKIWLDVSSLAPSSRITDPHWWLSPEVMKLAQAQLAEQLGADSSAFAAEVDSAMAESQTLLAPVRERGFFVFHRAYDHWVDALHLNQVGSFTLSPEQKPGMRTLQTMREQLQRGEAVCVFSEPEFSPALVDSLVEGLTVGRGELDPLGGNIEINPQGYPQFLLDMAHRAHDCLTGAGLPQAAVSDETRAQAVKDLQQHAEHDHDHEAADHDDHADHNDHHD